MVSNQYKSWLLSLPPHGNNPCFILIILAQLLAYHLAQFFYSVLFYSVLYTFLVPWIFILYV